jgi:uncharacterized protein (TIGR03435 family)
MKKQLLLRPLAGLLLVIGAVNAQPAAPAPASADKPKFQFEVASIKPAPPLNPQAIMAGKSKIGMSIEQSRVDIGSLGLGDLIQVAYKIKPHQITLLDWMKDPMSVQRFDIVAKMPEGATKDDVPQMLQALLAERFGLKIHKDTVEGQVMNLVVGKGGPKLKPSVKEKEPAEPAKDAKGTNVINFGGGTMKQNGTSMEMSVKDQPGKVKMNMAEGKMHYTITECTLDRFAEMVTQFVGQPVINKTDIKGDYDVEFEMSMADMLAIAQKAGVAVPPDAARALSGGGPVDPTRPADAASDPSANGGIMASLQQLGLKLDKGKGPVDHYIIDKVEKMPTEN